jgi:hypothetical protein
MAVAIAFFCINAVEAIQISCISMILNLNGFYSIYAKKRDSHGHLKCIKKLKFTHRSFLANTAAAHQRIFTGKLD